MFYYYDMEEGGYYYSTTDQHKERVDAVKLVPTTREEWLEAKKDHKEAYGSLEDFAQELR